MRLHQYKKMIQAAFNNEIALYLYSDPGEGKTNFVRDLAEEWGMEFIHINCHSLESTDIALPDLIEENGKKVVENIPCQWLKKAVTTDKPCLIFLDEINRIKPENENMLTTFVLEKTLYGHHFPNAKFLAAGNFDSKSTNTRELDGAIIDRFAHILFEVETVDAIEHIGDERVQEFYRINQGLLDRDSDAHTFLEDALGKIKPSKRTHAWASRVANSEDLADDFEVESQLIRGLLGAEVGAATHQAWINFRKEEANKVPTSIKGNEEACEQLLSKGMVSEIISLCHMEWKRGNKGTVARFILGKGSPELFKGVKELTAKDEDASNSLSRYKLLQRDLKGLTFEKDGVKIKGEDIPKNNRNFIIVAMMYTNLSVDINKVHIQEKKNGTNAQ